MRGPGDRAVLGDVADQDRRHPAALGDGGERARHRADLGRAAVGAVAGGADGLDAVEDQQRRVDLLDVAQDGGQLGLGGEVEPLVQGADPLGAQPHLAGGLLAGDDERRTVGGGDAVGDLEQQRRLADARARRRPAAPRPGTRPPPRTRSNSAMPVGTARAPASSTSAIGRAGAVTGPADDGAQRGRRGAELLDAAPGLALGAAADPLGRGVAALGAAVGGTGGLHSSGRHARDANRRHSTVPGRRGGPGCCPRTRSRGPRSRRRSPPGGSRRPRRAAARSSGLATVTGIVTSPAFSKVRVTSRYWPAVRPSSRSVRVIVSTSSPPTKTGSPGRDLDLLGRCCELTPDSIGRRWSRPGELLERGARSRPTPKPSPSTATRVSSSLPPLTIASCSSASSPLLVAAAAGVEQLRLRGR